MVGKLWKSVRIHPESAGMHEKPVFKPWENPLEPQKSKKSPHSYPLWGVLCNFPHFFYFLGVGPLWSPSLPIHTRCGVYYRMERDAMQGDVPHHHV